MQWVMLASEMDSLQIGVPSKWIHLSSTNPAC
jgi:hypothetical protein